MKLLCVCLRKLILHLVELGSKIPKYFMVSSNVNFEIVYGFENHHFSIEVGVAAIKAETDTESCEEQTEECLARRTLSKCTLHYIQKEKEGRNN
ncbi:hypothetical protein Fmac_031734 [Flemingia macrophylla]|uniref:Phytosulfokine n=1 Tax=Flemingia macrophylla TaxID=520843 RepID=A0ABD1L3C2_9FABA